MYGENTGLLRDSLRELLTHHRIQQRIGGPGMHMVPETTSLAERAQIGAQITRYRHAVLVWCQHAIQATNPPANLAHTNVRNRGPALDLRYRIEAAVNADPAPLPTTEELVTPQQFKPVDLWRQAARASAIGEHDFSAGVDIDRLTESQRMTVIHDTAEVTRALVGLDRRYSNIPGWQLMKDRGRLGRSAEICAAYSGTGEPGYSVDRRGWKPPAQLIEGPGLPGITGVLQAQHNLLLHLRKFPDAKSLRVVMDSQRSVSLETVRRLGDDPPLAARWERRTDVYARLVHATRDLGGMYGLGGPAAGQGAVATARMQNLSPEGLNDSQQLRRLERLSAGIDNRMCDAIEYGIKHRHYFQNILVPGMSDHDGVLVRVNRRKWLPLSGPVQAELLNVVRHDLRPAPVEPMPPEAATRNRRDFESAIRHRPQPRGAPPAGPSL